MTVAEALAFFEGERTVERSLQPLADVGLDYVQLGQAVPTLSGGEAQRLKLAGHLVATGTAKQHEHTLFLRSEERRVGKEGGSRWSGEQCRKKTEWDMWGSE